MAAVYLLYLLAVENVCFAHALEGGGPEPASDVEGLEPRLVATVNLRNRLLQV
jgi:hypothetical protein